MCSQKKRFPAGFTVAAAVTDLWMMKVWWRYSKPRSNWRTMHFTWIKPAESDARKRILNLFIWTSKLQVSGQIRMVTLNQKLFRWQFVVSLSLAYFCFVPEPQRTESACSPADWPNPAHSNSSPETDWNRHTHTHTYPDLALQPS